MPTERSAPSGGWREVYATMAVDPDGADEGDGRRPTRDGEPSARRPPAD